MSKNKIIIGSAVIIVVLAGAFLLWPRPSNKNEPVACTQEAKQCPDGSYVGRTGPDCAFAPCPESASSTIDTSAWLSRTDASSSISFRYPATLGTTYIRPVDWPPKVAVTQAPFSCTPAGSQIAPAGQTTQETINGRSYCVTQESQGAAGSIYTMYVYAAPFSSGTIIFTFSLQFPQCGNYPDPQMTACTAERQAFSLRDVMDAVVHSATRR